jgi:hypothetical protein
MEAKLNLNADEQRRNGAYGDYHDHPQKNIFREKTITSTFERLHLMISLQP